MGLKSSLCLFLSASILCLQFSLCFTFSLSPVAVTRGIKGMAEPSDLLELIT